MKSQLVLRRILSARLTAQRARNPSYSLRAFSRRIGITPGTLSLFLLGKRKVSRKLSVRIADRLGLDPQEKSELLEEFPKRTRGKLQETEQKSDPDYLQLTADQFNVIAEWEYFAILNLIGLKGARTDIDSIAARLAISVPRAKKAVERLVRLRMMRKTSSGFVREAPRYRTPDDVAIPSLQRSHHQTLELASRSLILDPVDRRDFTWVTFPFDTTKMTEAKTLLRKFQDDLLDLLEEDANPNEVYRLAIQLFPLTRPEKEK